MQLLVDIQFANILRGSICDSRTTLLAGVLSVMTIASEEHAIQNTMPKVPYTKAVDVWINMWMLYVFVAVMEFVLVNGVHRRYKLTHKTLPTGTILMTVPAVELVTQPLLCSFFHKFWKLYLLQCFKSNS